MQDEQGRWIPTLAPKGYEAFNDYHRFLLLEGCRKCVSEDTLLNTGYGLVRIGALGDPGDSPEGIKIESPVVGFSEAVTVPTVAVRIFKNTSEKAIRLTFNNGKQMTVSREHPLWISAWLDSKPFFGYASASMITDLVAKGTQVSVPFMTPPILFTEPPFVTIQVRRTTCAICELEHRAMGLCTKHFANYRYHKWTMPGPFIPEQIKLTTEVCYFLGAMCGDGSCRTTSEDGTKRGIGFTNDDKECVDPVRRVIEGLGGELKLVAKRYQYNVVCDKARKLLSAVGLTGLSKTKRIPHHVLNSSPPCLASFLSGLFDTDGTVCVKGTVSYTSTSEHLARDVQDALSVFGIFSVLKPRETHLNGKSYPCWNVNIYGEDARQFMRKVGFRISRKQARMNALPSVRKKFGYPSHIVEYIRGLSRSPGRSCRPNGWNPARVNQYQKKDGSISYSAQKTVCGKLIYRSRKLPEMAETMLREIETERQQLSGSVHSRAWHRANRWASIRDYVPTPEKLSKFTEEYGTTEELDNYTISDRWVTVCDVSECKTRLLDIEVLGCSSFLSAGYINHNSSKTINAVNKIARHLWENDGAIVGIIGKTLRNIKSSGVWQDLTTAKCGIPQWLESRIGFSYVDEPKMTGDTKMTFFRVRNMHGGTSECQVHSLEHEHEVEMKFKGGRWSMIYLPEADQFKDRHTFDILEDQLRIIDIPYDQHQLICDCNPPAEGQDHFLHDLFFKQTKPDGTPLDEKYRSKFHRIHFDLDDNPFITDEDRDTLKSKYLHDKNRYARLVEGKWEHDQTIGHFAEFFIENIHVRGNADSPDEALWQILIPSQSCMEVIVGWDTGDVNHAVSIIAPRDTGDVAAFDIIGEVVVLDQNMAIDEFVELVMDEMDFIEAIVKDRYGRDKIRWLHRSDTSALKFRSAADMTEILVVQQVSGGRILLRGVPKGRVRERISLAKRLLFDNRIFVSAQCKHHIEMFRYLRKGKAKTDIIEHKSPYKHVFDALTYALLEEVPEDIMRREEPSTSLNLVSVKY